MNIPPLKPADVDVAVPNNPPEEAVVFAPKLVPVDGVVIPKLKPLCVVVVPKFKLLCVVVAPKFKPELAMLEPNRVPGLVGVLASPAPKL